GFCLSWPLLDRPLPAAYWLKWFRRRALRIVPPYYGAIALFAGLQVLLHYRTFVFDGAATQRTELPTIKSVIVAATFYGTAFNASLWTLILEWGWSFLSPLPLLGFRKFGVVAFCLVTGVLSLLPRLYLIDSPQRIAAQAGPVLFSLPLFALGMIAARLYRSST